MHNLFNLLKNISGRLKRYINSFISRISITKIEKKNKIIVFIISLILILLLGILDYITSYEMSFSLFYLLPITIAVVFSSFRIGIVILFISAITWISTDLLAGHIYSTVLFPVWNTVMRVGYFFMHALLLTKIINLYRITKNLSLMDPLTNIGNWRLFQEIFQREANKAKRTHLPFSLIYFDLDNFKMINDTYGHSTGDNLLKSLSRVISSIIRPSDLLSRLGGDEFAVLLPETNFNETNIVIERIRSDAAKFFKKKNWQVTLSIGAITYTKYNLSINDMLKQVDDLMYLVKKHGKDNVEHQYYPKDYAGIK